MALTPNDSRNAYIQIADDLRRQIRNGEFGSGDKLPSTADLVAKYGVANMTIQGAFRVLREEDLIYSIQGRGTFVRSDIALGDAEGDGGTSTGEYSELHGQMETLIAAIGKLEQRVSQIEQTHADAEVKQ